MSLKILNWPAEFARVAQFAVTTSNALSIAASSDSLIATDTPAVSEVCASCEETDKTCKTS